MTLSPQFLDELRMRTSLSALVGKSVKLQKAGREMKGCCPFHDEKTPSFYVNDDKAFYHCFGCGAHGDAIRFLTEARGLPFIDAVKELAAAAGLEMPAADPRAAQKAEQLSGLHDVMAAAERWFGEQLNGVDGGAARAYLDRRGIGERERRAFGLGFAPDSRGRLKTALAKAGDAKLVEAGLLIAVDDKEPYDRFRGRLMIPIRDPRGRTIAFGGRIIGEGEPKYLNSPETPLFDKGRTLYNLDRAAGAARKAGRLIVVEGYLDVIALARIGIDEAVAPLGTALTEAQLERLWRLVDVPILCLDGDSAGQKAAIRAAQRALPMLAPARSLAFATLPPGQDPDDLARSGGRAAIDALLAAPEPLADRLWRHEQAALPLTTPEARAGLRKRLGALIDEIGDRDVRDQYRLEYRTRFDALFGTAPPAPARRRDWTERRGAGSWRGAPPPRPLSDAARAIRGTGTAPALVRAVLAGLIRFPDLIAGEAETIDRLGIGDPALARARDLMVDRGLAGALADLENPDAQAIWHAAGLAGAGEGSRRTIGLAFSFLRSNADPDRQRRDLLAAIGALAARPELEAALAGATERLMAEPDDAGFAEQSRLRAALAEADRALAALVGDGADI